MFFRRIPPLSVCFLIGFTLACAAGEQWPVCQPVSGFGANGNLTVSSDSFPSPQWHGKKVYVFHPTDVSRKYPLVLFCHGFGAPFPAVYGPLINNIVSRGHVLVYSPYKSFAIDPTQKKKYRILMKGFESAVERYSSFIDTTRVGIIGHSFGGGAVPAIGWHCFVENHWGMHGAFMYIMAPWYSYYISQEELSAFPQHVHLAMEIFHDDVINDPRMALDIFENIDVPDSQKVFIELFSDSMAGYRLTANHTTPQGSAKKGVREDALDFYGIYKFIDALSDHVFSGDSTAGEIAVGPGTAEQRFMGTWPDKRPVAECVITKSPSVEREKKSYINSWESTINPRRGDSPTFFSEIRKNRFYYARKTFRNYWEYEKERVRERRAGRKAPIDSSLCEIPPITEGFGAPGPYPMHVDSIPQPRWSGHFVHIFSPEGRTAPCPVIFFCHGYSSSNPAHYLPLIAHIVSKGFVCIFSPYQAIAMDPREVKKYATLETGFEAAVSSFRSMIDTTRIGYMGHSFGAGAVPAVALQGLVEKNWGSKAVFLYLMAPWYSYEIDDIKLKLFPSRAKMIVEVFNDDQVNDHRMAVNLFNTINIPQGEKNYIVLYSDSCATCRLSADHFTPKGPFDPRAEEDALDYYGIYRIFDALTTYTFDNDTSAKAFALGQGKQIRFMGTWPNGKPVTELTATSNPNILHPQDYYSFSWDLALNPLRKTSAINK
jgi:pimeloyl-ACP methyl ester carboxylesterase